MAAPPSHPSQRTTCPLNVIKSSFIRSGFCGTQQDSLSLFTPSKGRPLKVNSKEIEITSFHGDDEEGEQRDKSQRTLPSWQCRTAMRDTKDDCMNREPNFE